MMTPVLGLPDDDEMLVWARAVTRPVIEAKLASRVEANGGAERQSRADPYQFMAEYLVWKATPREWRPENWPTSERTFCAKFGMSVTSLLWYRRLVGFDRLVRKARRFQPGPAERVMEARNVAAQMLARQPDLDPKFADARWLGEVAKMEGLDRRAPLVQIQNNSAVLPANLSARDAEAIIADATAFFQGNTKVSTLPARSLDGRLDPVRPPELAGAEGQAPLRPGHESPLERP